MKKLLSVSAVIFILFTAKAQNCPSINLVSPDEITAGDTLEFIANIKGAPAGATYNWSISAGEIISGQGTPIIRLLTDSLGGMSVTATVELGGLPRECSSIASATADIMRGPEKIISAAYTTVQALTETVKKFITQTDLKNTDILQTAFIYVYSGVSTTAAQLKMMQATIADAFERNGISSYQYKIAIGGKKKTAFVEMYRLMSGAKEPKPSK